MAKENKKIARDWRLIPGGQKRNKSASEENEIFNELKKFLAIAQRRLKTNEFSEYTFIVKAGNQRKRENVIAANVAEAEGVIRKMYPFAEAELVEVNSEN